MANRTAKHIIKGKVQNWDRKIFTIEKVAPSEQGIVLQFGRPVRFRVVKLSLEGLPRKDEHGRKITWINNFAVLSSPRHYPKRHYTVFLPKPPKKAAFVYYDDRGLHRDKKPKVKGSKPEQPSMLQVDFRKGDPGIGWT